MKITKKQSKVFSAISLLVIMAIYVGINYYFNFSLSEAIFLLLAIPSILYIIISVLTPLLKKELDRLQKKETSEHYYEHKRRQFRKQGLKEFTHADWNHAEIEIWAINDAIAQKKYHSKQGQNAIKGKRNKGISYHANNVKKG